MVNTEQNYWIGIVGLLFCFAILQLNKDYWDIYLIRILFTTVAIFFVIFTLWNKLAGINKKEPMKGILKGVLKINSERIEIDNQSYSLKEVHDLTIQIRSFSGQLLNKGHSPGPKRSNGTSNSISFRSNDINIDKRFSIQSEQDYYLLKDLKDEIQKKIR